MITKKQILFLALIFFSLYGKTNAQCCAGGSGSPIAGGASQGVLLERQVDLNTNFQFINTDKFYKKDSHAPDSIRSFDSFSSRYEYFRLAYGITKNFTMSVESGYYFKKKENGLDSSVNYESKGIGDLILFPRYDVINNTGIKHRTEVTVGLGFKIPLGSYNDSTGIKPAFPAYPGQVIYLTKPQSVQLSSGAQDIIFYLFLFRGYTEHNFRIFANAMYIKKGWNPNGEKLGDFTSFTLCAGKSFFNHLGITLQTRYEQVDKMKILEDVLLFGKPSTYEPNATGYKKVFIVPQLRYTRGKFTIYGLTEFPIYQYINNSPYYTQAGSKHSTTVGISYKFFAQRSIVKQMKGTGKYYCPMHPEETSDKPGKCSICGMDLIKAK